LFIHIQKNEKLKKMKRFFNNIKTTVFGAVAGLPLLVDGIATKDFTKIFSGIGAILVGLFAKDHDSQF
jgi:hypothetical protein